MVLFASKAMWVFMRKVATEKVGERCLRPMAVPTTTVVAFALLLFEDDDLAPALVFKYSSVHSGSVYKWRAQFEFLTFPKGEHFVDFDFRAGVGFGITI